jgi:hypothetical protein
MSRTEEVRVPEHPVAIGVRAAADDPAVQSRTSVYQGQEQLKRVARKFRDIRSDNTHRKIGRGT